MRKWLYQRVSLPHAGLILILYLFSSPCSTKFVDEKWLYQNELKDPECPLPRWWDLPLSSLSAKQAVVVSNTTTVSQALQEMKRGGVTVTPVLDQEG